MTLLPLLVLPSAFGQAGRITVDLDKPGHRISPTFYGLMTEEINHAYDGGLYGELIRNRALKDDPAQPVFWSFVAPGGGSGLITLDHNQPVPNTALSESLKLQIDSGSGGLANEGFWGVPVWPHTRYRASFFAKAAAADNGPWTVAIESADGAKVYASEEIRSFATDWQSYNLALQTSDTEVSAGNRFVIVGARPGTAWFSEASLFPPTYNGRRNGNRSDLMEKLAALNPSFLRLPGGNYLEGDTIATRFNWKETLGDTSQRPGHQGPWGYRSSDGLGLLEYLEWCEDLHMQPVLAVYAGYSLHGEHVAPGPDLDPYVQDALDEIEYVRGGPTTKWGAVRAANGHRKPFPLTFVEIGNEDGFDRSGSYDGRFTQFFKAIKARDPNLQIIATAPVKSCRPDVIDDHYYRSAEDMMRDSGHYDRYDRGGPKIFVGEWASVEGSPTPLFKSALGDAAWLTGLERDSDAVVMESYAPLFVNVNKGAAQWGTNLIGYDALTSFGSPSYWVQVMFANNTGDRVLPSHISLDVPKQAPTVYSGGVGLGTYRTDSEFKDLKVTKDGQAVYAKDFSNGTGDWKMVKGTWKTEGDSLRQTSEDPNTRAIARTTGGTDYTVEVKARKLGGHEGFFVIFHYKNDTDYWQWNIGGWENTRSAIQHTVGDSAEEVGRATGTTVGTGRWYDIRMEFKRGNIYGYIDGKLITTVKEEKPPMDPLYVAASRKGTHGDVFLKVVNASEADLPLKVRLRGADRLAGGTVWLLKGELEDQNSVAEPEKIAPKMFGLESKGPIFSHTFPGHSVTIMRLHPS